MEMIPVQVEADVSDGMPQFTMVGYVSAQVKEAQDRVRTALKNMGISLPPKRITINLSPADVRKEGSRFDLPIAAGVLMTLGRIPPGSLRKTMVLGELGLDGHVQEISGVFPAAAKARELGCTTLLVPAGNAAEGGLVGGLHVVGIQNLQELLNYCCEGKMPSLPSIENQKKEDGKEPDFSEVQGQTAARRAALIAAAGFHNLLMLGPPGSGKSMIARRIPTIMPPMSEEEQMEVTRIYSIAGMLAKGEGVRRERPFRAPHHTMSPQALAGGGKQPSPGEITLAHRGVLFLDELPEMTRTTIEILRQPLEEHRIVISRVSGNYGFPASFLMVAAMNPCPCGFYPDLSRCTCAPGDISRYLSRVSQPFLDEPVLSPCLYDNGSGFSGTGAERAAALMNLYRDPEITDIFDISGGDMANEVLPYLDFYVIAASGKRFWGYSDLTTIVNAITAATGNESMLYQVRNLLYDHSAEQITLFQNAFSGQSPSLFDFPCTFLQGDHMEGVLIGGNIRCFLKLAGTDFQPDFRGKILLLEAMGGGVPQMVTFLSQLKMMHAFEQINGILLGTFSKMECDQLTPDMPHLVRQFAGSDLPIAQTPYIGHGTDAHAAVIGRFYQISSD